MMTGKVCLRCQQAAKAKRKGGLARYTCRHCKETVCHHNAGNRVGLVCSCTGCLALRAQR